ncbi:MAG TPA: hypothetical protein VGE72_06440 [Azospirillum sp.]
MAEPAHAFSEDDAERKREAIETARRDFQEGRWVEHKRVRDWLSDLAAGKVTPRPRCK